MCTCGCTYVCVKSKMNLQCPSSGNVHPIFQGDVTLAQNPQLGQAAGHRAPRIRLPPLYIGKIKSVHQPYLFFFFKKQNMNSGDKLDPQACEASTH